MKRLVAQHPLIAFTAMAFGIAWAGWVPAALASYFQPAFRVPNPVFSLAIFAFGPTFAALIVTGLVEGRPGLRQLLRRVIAWRFPLRWYLIALLSPAALFLAGGLLRAVAGGPAFRMADAAIHSQSGLNPWLMLPVLLLAGLFIGPLNEEIGWRGFALPHLQRRWSPLVSTLILGTIWGAWHLPLFFVPGMSQVGQPIIPFLVSVLVNSFFYTWICNRTGGSVLPAILLHDAFNTSSAYIPAPPSEERVIGATAVAVAVLLLMDRRSWIASPPATGQTAAD